jgi:hypothetical protein
VCETLNPHKYHIIMPEMNLHIVSKDVGQDHLFTTNLMTTGT